MEKTDIEAVKRGSVHGVVALTSRTFFLQSISLFGTFVLTVILSPAAYGIFAIVSSAINFLNYFSDIGLAAALVQKKEEPTRDDLVTTFTLQQILVGVAVCFTLFFSRKLAAFYGFDQDGLFLLRALAISFLLSSFKTIPSVLLERALTFHKLVVPQIVETFSFYLVAIVLAVKGFGVASYAWAALVRGFLGVILLYIIAPWKPGLRLEMKSVKKLLSYGIPYQANSFIALIKDDLLIVFLGKSLSFEAVGYIVWAKKWAEVPLRLIMDSIVRVTFPAYARLQGHKEVLGRAIEKSFFFLALFVFPILVGMILVIKPIIFLIPRYAKWEPALFSFYLLTFSSILAALSSPLVNALNAIGKIFWTLRLMLMWTILTWVLVPFLTMAFGYNGYSIAAVIIATTSFIPIFVVRRFVSFTFLPHIIKPVMATIIMGVTVAFLLKLSSSNGLSIGLDIVIGMIVYWAVIGIVARNEIMPMFEKYFRKS